MWAKMFLVGILLETLMYSRSHAYICTYVCMCVSIYIYIYIYKWSYILYKSNIENMKWNQEIHGHCTCHKSDLHVKFCRTTLFKNNFANVGIKLYNKLPNKVQELEKLKEFKRKLKYFLPQHIFYSVNEYMSFRIFFIHYLLLCMFYYLSTSVKKILILQLMSVLLYVCYYIYLFSMRCIVSWFSFPVTYGL
jgi:hypothetical protein